MSFQEHDPGLTSDTLGMYVMYLVLWLCLHSLHLVGYELCRPDVSRIVCTCHGNSKRKLQRLILR